MEAAEVQVNNASSLEMTNIQTRVQEPKPGERAQKAVAEQGTEKHSQKLSEVLDEKRIAHEIADSMNKVVVALHTHLSFRVHESTGQMIVQVIDSETGEVRRQIPPEEMVRLVDKMRTLVGMIFNEEA